MNRTLAIILCLSPAVTLADSIAFGVAQRCDPSQSGFELIGLVEANGEIQFASDDSEGLVRLSEGEAPLSCRVGGAAVTARVRVFAADNGTCMGAGYVDVTQFKVGARELRIEGPGLPFNWSCPGRPMTVRLSARVTGRTTVVEHCLAEYWTWERGYGPIRCSELRLR